MKSLDWLLHPRQEYIDQLCVQIADLRCVNADLLKEISAKRDELASERKKHEEWMVRMAKGGSMAFPEVKRDAEPEWSRLVDWERVGR